MRGFLIGLLATVSVQGMPAYGQGLPTVFGQPLGQPPAFPKCTFSIPEPDCVSTTPLGSHVLFDSSPDIVTLGGMDLRIINGDVEGVDVELVGHAHRALIMRQLTAKFGSASSIRPEGVAPYGIELTQVAARWRRAGYSVIYKSIDGDMEHGSLRIRTTKGLQADFDSEAAQEARKTKL